MRQLSGQVSLPNTYLPTYCTVGKGLGSTTYSIVGYFRPERPICIFREVISAMLFQGRRGIAGSAEQHLVIPLSLRRSLCFREIFLRDSELHIIVCSFGFQTPVGIGCHVSVSPLLMLSQRTRPRRQRRSDLAVGIRECPS